MAKRKGVDARYELQSESILRDARPWTIRAGIFMGHPRQFAVIMGILGLIGVVIAALSLLMLLLNSLLCLWFFRVAYRRQKLPLRLPQQANLIDPSELNIVTRQKMKSKGILYLGNNRLETGGNEEVWTNNDDARTHFLFAGTTGSGKTQTLLGICFNALAWGSGFIYVDGKADNDLPFSIYSLCRRMGRDDHFFVLNFMTGGVDTFANTRNINRRSNTFNPFSRGTSDDLTQLMTSLMPPAGGDGGMWQGLAVGMLDAVIRVLCYKRATQGLEIDAAVIRDSVDLTQLIQMVKELKNDQKLPRDLVFKPMEAYLRNLPGMNWEDVIDGDAVPDPETKKQHDFRSMQFLRQLTLLADTYGKVFKKQIPEVDVVDVVLNNRILVVMIPSLEKSKEESGAVGKLVVTALKMMMALNLGGAVEGLYKDAVDSKATKSPSPFICILDELGYYFTEGLAVIFAQARSLGFMMVAALQDFPAIMRGSNAEEAQTVIANTKFKISLAMEDMEKTGDFFIKAGGKVLVTEVSGFSGTAGVNKSNYTDRMDASVQERDRVTLQELKDLDVADAVLMWRDEVVRLTTFAPFIRGAKQINKEMNLNRMIALPPPHLSEKLNELKGFVEIKSGFGKNISRMIEDIVDGKKSVDVPLLNNSALSRSFSDLGKCIPSNPETIKAIKDLPSIYYDISLYSRLFGLLSENENFDQMNGGYDANDPDMVGDEYDVSDIIPNFPVNWEANAVTSSSLSLTQKTSAVLDSVDQSLTSKLPANGLNAKEKILAAVEYKKPQPSPEHINAQSAMNEIEDMFNSILDNVD